MRVIPAVALFALAASATLAKGDPASGDIEGTPRLVVLLAEADQGADVTAILQNTRAELIGLNVAVVVKSVGRFPSAEAEQEAMALEMLIETGAAILFWYDTHGAMSVRFLYRTAAGPRGLVRGLEGSGREGVAEAIGLIAGGTVRFLVRQGTLDDSPSPAAEQEVAKRPALPSAPTPKPAENTDRRVRLLGSIGYVGQLATRDPDFTHGGRLSLAVSVDTLWRFSVGAELVTAVESVSSAGDVSFERFRFPLHLGVGAVAPVGGWRLGGTLSAVFSSARHTQRTTNDRIVLVPERYRFLFTVEALARVERVLSQYLGLFLEIGTEIFFEKVTYQVENGPVLFEEFLRIQPKLALGIVLNF